MDELDLITRFREETPDPDAQATARARATLMSAMAHTPARPHRAPWRSRRAWGLAAAVVAAAVAIAVAIPAMLPGGRTPEAAAAEMLRKAAVVAAQQPPPPSVGPGQFVYTKSISAWRSYAQADPTGETTWTLDRFTREIWIAPDGSGRILEQGDRTTDEAFGPDGLYFGDLSELPTDLDGLRSYIEERASQADPPTDYEMFVVIGDLLRETYATPELRAALYRVAATLSRTELLGETTDELGRPGIGIGYTWLGVRRELIFDPETSFVLGEREVQVDPPVDDASPAPGIGVNADGVSDPGTLIGWSSTVASGIVDSTTERP